MRSAQPCPGLSFTDDSRVFYSKKTLFNKVCTVPGKHSHGFKYFCDGIIPLQTHAPMYNLRVLNARIDATHQSSLILSCTSITALSVVMTLMLLLYVECHPKALPFLSLLNIQYTRPTRPMRGSRQGHFLYMKHELHQNHRLVLCSDLSPSPVHPTPIISALC